MQKLLTIWITITAKKFLKRGESQIILPVSWETCMQVKKQKLEPHIEQWTGSKWENMTRKILSPCLFKFYEEYIMQNARLDESQAGIKISGRNINNLSYADVTTLMQKVKRE